MGRDKICSLDRNILYQCHLPSEIRVFEYNSEPVYAGSDAVVFDSLIHDTHCRGYYFLDSWLSVFITFDEQLKLKPDSNHNFPFAFNCDITTPHYWNGNSIFTSDLYIDILVGADGSSYQLEDMENFQNAFEKGLFGRKWLDGARQEAEQLIDLLESAQFLDFLNKVEPFPAKKATYTQEPMRKYFIDEIRFKHHPKYPRYE